MANGFVYVTRIRERFRKEHPSLDDDVRVPLPPSVPAFMLLRYIELVCDDLQLQEFRAKLRELAPGVEQAAVTIAEQMRREGEARGRFEGRVQVLTKQLTLKFGAIGAEQLALIGAATDEDLDRYVERVLTADTLAAVFAT